MDHELLEVRERVQGLHTFTALSSRQLPQMVVG